MIDMKENSYRFSGHETFYCRQYWLKRGYDFILQHDVTEFKTEKAIMELAVGKNMVTSILFWMRAFGILDEEDNRTLFANSILSDDGFDPYLEDDGTLWLLHYRLCSNKYASIYHMIFNEYVNQKTTGLMNEERLMRFLLQDHPDSSTISNSSQKSLLADIKVFLSMYVPGAASTKSVEDRNNSLLLDLNLISRFNEDKSVEKYYLIQRGLKKEIPVEILAYCTLDKLNYMGSNALSFNKFYNDVAMYFGLTVEGAEQAIQRLVDIKKFEFVYRDNAGVKELQLKGEAQKLMDKTLKWYYNA